MDLLVEPDWLEERLADPDVRIVDATWYGPEEEGDGRAEYEKLHLPGAAYLDLSTDLADRDSPVRNTVASPDAIALALGRAGISNESRVVVYDRKAGYSAGRIWWTLRYVGHARVALLNGGFERWRSEGRPLSADVPAIPPVHFEATVDSRWLRSKPDVERIAADGSAVIVDARSAARFRGEGPEPARRRGHIPGSKNVPWASNLRGEPPVFLKRGELRGLYEEAGVRFDRPVVTTCGSGVTAALEAFLLVLAGHADVSVYDGSWAEWCLSDDVPVERGPGDPGA